MARRRSSKGQQTTRGGAGRQRGRNENRPHRLGVRLDDATMAAIEREAKRLGWTESRVAAERLKRSFAAGEG